MEVKSFLIYSFYNDVRWKSGRKRNDFYFFLKFGLNVSLHKIRHVTSSSSQSVFFFFCITRCVGSQLIPRDGNIFFLTLHIIRRINERISFMWNINKCAGSYYSLGSWHSMVLCIPSLCIQPGVFSELCATFFKKKNKEKK